MKRGAVTEGILKAVTEATHGLTSKELARQLGVPQGTASSRLFALEQQQKVHRNIARRGGCAVYFPGAGPAAQPTDDAILEAYKRGYRDGFKDGIA